MADSPFEIVTSKPVKKGNKGFVIAIIIVTFLILSVAAGVLLVRQQQNIQEKASVPKTCPDAQACPNSNDPHLLQSCDNVETDGTPQDSNCDTAGRVEICGGVNFCCPSAGGSWSSNLSVCDSINASPSPSPSASPSSSPSPSASPTASPGGSGAGSGSSAPTPTATPRRSSTPIASGVQTTPRPVPTTGVDWPTTVGIGIGVVAIILSVLVAF